MNKTKEQLAKENLELAKELGISLEDKPNPIEEVKKEWEEAGYEWKEFKESKEIHLTKRKDTFTEETIKISLETKYYIKFERCVIGYFPNKLSLQEHQLLTKTFRAKGWEM